MVRTGDKPPSVFCPYVAWLLVEHRHVGHWYSASSLAAGLNTVGIGSDMVEMSNKLLRSAFLKKSSGDGSHREGDVAFISFSSLGVKIKGFANHVLGVWFMPRESRVDGEDDERMRNRVAIGRFRSMKAGNDSGMDVKEWCAIPVEQREGLVQLLRDRRTVELKRASAATATRRPLGPKKRDENSADLRPSSSGTNSGRPPPKKRGKTNTFPQDFKDKFEETNTARQPNLHYTIWGRAGKMYVGENEVVTTQLLIDNLEPPTKCERDTKKRDARYRRYFVLFAFGASQYWVPIGATGVSSSHLSFLSSKAEKVDRLTHLLSHGKCCWDDSSMRLLSIFNLHNMNASDEVTEALVFATVKCIVNEMGLHLPNEKIAKSCPSKTLIAKWQKRLAVECVFVLAAEMKRDGAKFIALCCDHGKRNQLEHYVKLISWGGFASNLLMGLEKGEVDRPVIKYACISVDMSDKTAQGAADAIKKSLETLEIAGLSGSNKVETCHFATDNGGGAGLTNVEPKLRQNKVLGPDSGAGNCQYHGHNKSYENASIAAFGPNGLGKANIFQAAYQYSYMVKHLKEDLGLETVADIREIVLKNLCENEELQNEVFEQNSEAFKSLMSQLLKVDVDKLPEPNEIAGSLDELLQGASEPILSKIESEDFTKNITDMTFSRWRTTNEGIKVFLNNWTEIYALAIAVKSATKATHTLHKVACDLLGLMNIRVKVEDVEEGADEAPGEVHDSADHYPPVYIEGLFIVAFCDRFFDRHFDFVSAGDPQFPNSFGHQMRLYIEHAAFMHDDLLDMMANFQTMEEFEPFMKAINKLPASGVVFNADKTFFLTAAGKFFSTLKSTLDKHTFKRFRSDSSLVNLVGGNSSLAIQLLKWLKCYEDGEIDMANHQFEDATIYLKHHGETYGTEGIKVSLRKMMDYLIRGPPGTSPEHWADPKAIIEHPIIAENKDLLWRMAGEDKIHFDLFDSATWSHGSDFTAIQDVVHKRIAIQFVHQQRCELHVQMAAYVASTSVGEVRRTCRCICLSVILRPYHQWALRIAQRKRDEKLAGQAHSSDDKRRRLSPKVTRVEGNLRMALLAGYADKFAEVAEDEMSGMSKETIEAVWTNISTNEEKMSTDLKKKAKEVYKKAVKKKRSVTKSEMCETGLTFTTALKGSLSIKHLVRRNETAIDAELVHRELLIPDPDDPQRQVKLTSALLKTRPGILDNKKTSIKIKKTVLIESELKILAVQANRNAKKTNTPIVLSKVDGIVAQSEEMKALIENVD